MLVHPASSHAAVESGLIGFWCSMLSEMLTFSVFSVQQVQFLGFACLKVRLARGAAISRVIVHNAVWNAIFAQCT